MIEAPVKWGAVVIAGGGGGIPVICGPKRVRRGVGAVIGYLNEGLPALPGETGTHIVPDEC